MAAIPPVYFQAGATAIPGILIALAVGARLGKAHAEAIQKETKGTRFAHLTVIVVVGVAATVAEVSAWLSLLYLSRDFRRFSPAVPITNDGSTQRTVPFAARTSEIFTIDTNHAYYMGGQGMRPGTGDQ